MSATIFADSEDDAWDRLEELVKRPDLCRLTDSEQIDDGWLYHFICYSATDDMPPACLLTKETA